MIQFYSPEIETKNILPEGESAHCCRVLRMQEGDEIFITDGKGSRFRCEIIKANPKATQIRILEKLNICDSKGYEITLAVAPTKNPERMEWLAEKAVELGVDKIVLLKCHRSERKFMKSERLKKVMISAMKQSWGVKLPELVELTEFSTFIKTQNENTRKFFGYCSEELSKKEFAKEYQPGEYVTVLIGPEGDFTPEEVNIALANDFMPVTFGERRLRTETAGVYVISAINTINQRYNN